MEIIHDFNYAYQLILKEKKVMNASYVYIKMKVCLSFGI